MPIVTLDPAKKAVIDHAKAVAEVDAWFASQVAAGFETADGWKLGLSEQDVSLLTGNFVLSREAALLGMPIPPIIDAEGVPHPLEDVQELVAIMLAYGQHRAALSAEYAARKSAIEG